MVSDRVEAPTPPFPLLQPRDDWIHNWNMLEHGNLWKLVKTGFLYSMMPIYSYDSFCILPHWWSILQLAKHVELSGTVLISYKRKQKYIRNPLCPGIRTTPKVLSKNWIWKAPESSPIPPLLPVFVQLPGVHNKESSSTITDNFPLKSQTFRIRMTACVKDRKAHPKITNLSTTSGSQIDWKQVIYSPDTLIEHFITRGIFHGTASFRRRHFSAAWHREWLLGYWYMYSTYIIHTNIIHYYIIQYDCLIASHLFNSQHKGSFDSFDVLWSCQVMVASHLLRSLPSSSHFWRLRVWSPLLKIQDVVKAQMFEADKQTWTNMW